MGNNFIVSYKDIRAGNLERRFDTFSEALKHYEEVKQDEDIMSAELNILKPFAVYIKGIRENGK